MDVSISKRMMSLFGLLCAGALMWASALFCECRFGAARRASGSARIYILPFEYMDAILIESDGHFGMVDSGESSDSPDGSDSRYPVRSGTTVGQGVEDQVTAFMQSMGVTSENFDFYIGTHPHSDHIGAAGQIISAFKPARIYTPLYDDSMITNPDALWDNQYVYDLLVSAAQEAQEEYGASFIQRFDESAPVNPEDGSAVGNPHFTLGSAQIDIMNTNGSDALGTFVDANCISLGVKVTAGGATAFLSGDINNLCGAEDALASELGHVDFLKLGHHGCNNSNSIGYIKALSPKFVFQTGWYSTMRELVRALWEIDSRYYSSADVVNDGSAAFEVSLSSAGVAIMASITFRVCTSGNGAAERITFIATACPFLFRDGFEPKVAGRGSMPISRATTPIGCIRAVLGIGLTNMARWRLVGAKSMASGISSITAGRCRRAGTTMVRLGIGLALTALWRRDGVLSRGRGIASIARALCLRVGNKVRVRGITWTARALWSRAG